VAATVSRFTRYLHFIQSTAHCTKMHPFQTVTRVLLIASIANSVFALRPFRPSSSSSSSSQNPWTSKDVFNLVKQYGIQGVIAGIFSGYGSAGNRAITDSGAKPSSNPTPTNSSNPISSPVPSDSSNPSPNPFDPGPANSTNLTYVPSPSPPDSG
jgi:hypothetical protein